jgi:23S rRNA (adenine2503-C2)-methyltransferase
MPFDVKALDAAGLRRLATSLGQSHYRASQLARWLYARRARSFDEMTDLPKSLRATLNEQCALFYPLVVQRHVSEDGTRKLLLQLSDGAFVECVGIPSGENRLTVCYSTQVGCAMGCLMCATGRSGLTRSLTTGEMLDQLNVVAEDFSEPDQVRVTNAVAMGQGEPFANYDALLAALRLMNDPELLGIGARRLSVSTCGLLRQIGRFGDEPEQFTLAVSLHSAVQATRDLLLPRLSAQPLTDLRSALVRYRLKSGRRPTLEFALVKGINDTDQELEALLAFCAGAGAYLDGGILDAHVNLIPLNVVDHLNWKPATAGRVKEFGAALASAGVEVSVRASRGGDIAAACGQLAATKK